MGKEKTKKRFGILLAAVLLFQLSYHSLHVFTSHIWDSHIEHGTHHSQIDKTSLNCELCAKLLGPTLFPWVYPTLLITLAVAMIVINIGGLFFEPDTLPGLFLRGPPLPFS